MCNWVSGGPIFKQFTFETVQKKCDVFELKLAISAFKLKIVLATKMRTIRATDV